ncbi:NTP/NDP exchange transporter [Arenimonas sp. MALMAid1274]|uniref:NTP/NDP exchange transporter n=1 Tax=Arenimonas sp. MALMAid1274 TaxID=3411630 RepID=UPI003B9EF895
MTPGTETAGRFDHLRGALQEFPPLLWSFLYFFFLLTGYYVLRPVRDAMGASADVEAVFPLALVEWATARGWALGDLTLQLLFTGTFLAMLLLQPAYGALVSRYPRRVFLPVLYGLFIACLVGFYFVFGREVPGRGAIFFIWVAVFNLFAVSVFWSFMADIYSDIEARRLYGFIAAGGTAGGFLGPVITRALVHQIGVPNLLLVSACLLAACVFCILRLGRWARMREQSRGLASAEQAMGGSVWAGLRLVAQQPLLRAMAVVMFFGIGVGTLLYNEQAAIARAMASAEERTAFFANLDLAINALTILVQVFLTRPLLVRWGVAPVLMIPAVAILIGFSVLAASPLPMLIAVVQVITRASEFSLAKPGRETVYTRVDREVRYKAKAVIDTAVYRAADLTFVWVHKLIAGFGSSVVFMVGIGIAAGMTFGAWRLIKEQAKLPSDPR